MSDQDDEHDAPAPDVPGDQEGGAISPRRSAEIEPFDPASLPVAALPSAAPTRGVRLLAFASIVIAGLCGGLIGYAFTDLQCTDGCSTLAGFGALVGALIGAVGVAIVAVLVLRAMDEWDSVKGDKVTRRRDPS